MSVVNRFQELFSASPKATESGTVEPPARRVAVAPNEPATLSRCIAIHKGFTRKALAAETDPEWIAAFQRLANFDKDTGYWTPPVGFTQGEAKALQDRLYALPWKSNKTLASKVTTTQAAPLPKTATVTDEAISARVEAATAASKDSRLDRIEAVLAQLLDTVPDKRVTGNSVPDGFEVAVGKKGPYLRRIR
jgi:hypothetical protein